MRPAGAALGRLIGVPDTSNSFCLEQALAPLRLRSCNDDFAEEIIGTMLRRAVLYLFSLLLLALLSRSALALDPTQPTANYLRTTFTVEDGLPDNVVNAILQSRDGFLWIGTYAGLVRFNGRDFMPVDFRMAGSVSQAVVALAEGPD
jgi:hypothetical protein